MRDQFSDETLGLRGLMELKKFGNLDQKVGFLTMLTLV